MFHEPLCRSLSSNVECVEFYVCATSIPGYVVLTILKYFSPPNRTKRWTTETSKGFVREKMGL